MGIVKKYPKLLLLLFCTLLAYILFRGGAFEWLAHIDGIAGSYFAIFLGGILFTFGFTAPFGIGVFIEVAPHVHPFYGALLGAVGCMLGDLVIFEVMKFEFFHEEITRLRTTRVFLWGHRLLHHESISDHVRQYLLWSFAGIIIASPLPDEFGVALVTSITEIKACKFAVLSLIFNSIGIFLILEATRVIIT
ncbi:hypothetical protein FJZ28_02950 [Candidatus Peregrinibacteria bacterium]|nr:hypothetical protein [Candidatus Peregrinibacteria bacterium]